MICERCNQEKPDVTSFQVAPWFNAMMCQQCQHDYVTGEGPQPDVRIIEQKQMLHVYITDESIVAMLRDAGYICEIDNTGVVNVYINPIHRPLLSEGFDEDDWYVTDCPLEHGKPVAGVVLVGTMVIKAEEHAQTLEQARAAYKKFIGSE